MGPRRRLITPARPGDQPRHTLGAPMSDLSNDHAEEMNSKALGTLLGFSSHKSEDLVALLRSGAPISRTVRDELANAIESKSTAGIKFTISGNQPQKKRIEGIAKRRQWLALGEQVARLIDQDCNITGDIHAKFEFASAILNKSSDDCRKRYYYFKNYQAWSLEARKAGLVYEQMSDKSLQFVWHLASIDQGQEFKPVPPNGPGYDEMYHERTQFLRWLISEGPTRWPEDLAEQFVALMLVFADVAVPD